LTRSTVTSGSGTYSLPTLPVGAYTVTAEAGGFKVASFDVTLDTNQQREVNFTLALAGTTSQVEVSAAPPLLTTTNATLGGLVNGQQVSTLPLNGRDITNLILLQPGVNFEPNSSFNFLNYVAGNGNRGTTGSSFMDNIDTTDNELGGGQFSNFNLDAIAEFRVLQNNYSSEYGRGSGTIVTLVSRSGSNQIHGSAFEFVRNSAFAARNFFSNGPGSAGDVPPFRRNEFGGTFGGPIRKDKAFYFVQYAGFRQRLGEPNVIKVPTALQRQGIVNIVGANGQPDQLMVPLNPVAQTVLNAYPLPNQPNGPLGPQTYSFQYSLPENHDQGSARVDYHFSDKDSVFGRFTFGNNRLPATDAVAASQNKAFSSHLLNDQRNAGLTYTHVFSPTLLNTFRAGWTLTDEFIGPGTTAVTQTTFADSSLANYGADTTIFKLYPSTFTFNNGINWVKGRHAFNLGGEFRRVIDNEFGASVGGPNGFFNFNTGTPLPVAVPSASGKNNIPAGGASPSGLVSLMEGAAVFYQRTLAFPGFGPPGGGFAPFGIRRWHLNGWFQDDFKWTRKLTVNLGLRYEYNSVPIEAAGRLAGIVDDSTFKGGSLYRKLVLNPDPIYFPDRRGFGPRVGFAYKVASKTVLRGGFGIFTNLPLTQTADQQAFGFPFASTAAINKPTYSLTPLPVFGLPVLTDLQGNPLPPGGDTKKVPPNTPVNLAPVAAYFGGPVLVNYTSMNLRNGYTMAGNVTVEREIPGDIVLQVAYVTNNAAKLYASEWPNGYSGALPQYTLYTQANPGLGEFQLTDNHAHSTYNSLQTMLRKVSDSHGLQFQVSYTYSKSIDNATTVFNGPGTNSALIQNDPTCWRCEKSVSSFDFPHRFVANFIYALPFDRWQSLSSAPRRLVQGWQITSIIQAQSGYPFTVNSPFGTVQFGTDTYAGVAYARPDLVQQPTLKTSGGAEQQFFSDAVVADGSQLGQPFFATPGAVTIANGKPVVTGNPQSHPGDLGRNTFRTHSFSNFDVSLIKDTKLTESSTLQFRAEFFNLFNQHAFNMPGATLGSSGFGVATSTVFAERQIQLALRLIF